MFFVNGRRVLQLLLNILCCTQNCKFYFFLETKISFVKKKKIFNIFLGLCIYFVQKSLKMILENPLLKSFWTALSLSVHNIPSHFYDLILA